jgi:hypothetical protein
VLKSKNISQKAKLSIYKIIIWHVVTYGSKTWILSEKGESQINMRERKVLRKIFGPVNDRGIWRIRSNKELAGLYQETQLATVIKTSRLRWLGYVCRMEEQRDPKKALGGKPGGRRKRGKQCTRCIDNMEDDLRKLGIKRWRLRIADRT